MKNVNENNIKNYIYKTTKEIKSDLKKAYKTDIIINIQKNNLIFINSETGEIIAIENIYITLEKYYETIIKNIRKQIINNQLEAIWMEYKNT